jgi:hypothetical protein
LELERNQNEDCRGKGYEEGDCRAGIPCASEATEEAIGGSGKSDIGYIPSDSRVFPEMIDHLCNMMTDTDER